MATPAAAENLTCATPAFEPRSMTVNFLWTLGGNVIGTGCQWLLIVLLAKLTNPGIVGQLALALAVAGPITFFADFRLRLLYVTDHKGAYDLSEMLGLRVILLCAAVAIVTITCLIAHFSLSVTATVLIVAFSQLTDFLSETYYGELQKRERMDRVAKSLVARNVLAACGFTAIIYLTRNLVLATIALVVARCLVLVFYDSATAVLGKALVRPAWNRQRQWTMFVAAVPLAIVALLVSLTGYIPRYVLEADLGKTELGIYSAINYIPAGCGLVVSAIGYAVFARLARHFGNGELADFKKLLAKIVLIYAGIGVSGVLVSVVMGPTVLRIVYGPIYAEKADILRWLMIVAAVQTITTAVQCGITAASRFAIQVPLFATVAFLSFAGCYVLIPRYKLEGAAMAVLIATCVQLCASTTIMLTTVAKRERELASPGANAVLAELSVSQ